MLSDRQKELISPNDPPCYTTKQAALTQFESSYPLLQQWRLLVDGRLYATVPQMRATPDPTGWKDYEGREPNSIAAFFLAWQYCLKQLKYSNDRKALTIDFIVKLHTLATQNVEKITANPGQFRKGNNKASFSLVSPYFIHRITEAGAKDLAKSLTENQAQILAVAEGQSNTCHTSLLKQACYLQIYRNNEGEIKAFTIRGQDLPLQTAVKYLSEDDKLSGGYFLVSSKQTTTDYQVQKLVAPTNETDLTSTIYQKIQQQGILYLGTTPYNQSVFSLVTDTLTHYNNSIATLKDSRDKLCLIGKTIERLERIHPFSDGNGRVFVNLLLNYLLLEEGFPPATLYEPNLFDAFGYHVEVLTKGMLNTQAIYAGENNLFGFTMKPDEKKEMNKIITKSLIKGLLDYLSESRNAAECYIESLTVEENNTFSLNAEELLEMLNYPHPNTNLFRLLSEAELVEIQQSLATIKTATLEQENTAFIEQPEVVIQAIDRFSSTIQAILDETTTFKKTEVVNDWDQFATNQYTLFGQREQDSPITPPPANTK